jgi:outer membrane protein assembly factor BamB
MTYRTQLEKPQADRSLLVVGLGGRVVALDRATGEVTWTNDLPGGSFGEVFIAVDFGVVLASAHGDVIYCLDYLTGMERWRAKTSASGRATIIIEPDQIFCAKSGYVDSFDPAGQKLWTQPLRGKGVGRVALGLPGNFAQADDPGSQ